MSITKDRPRHKTDNVLYTYYEYMRKGVSTTPLHIPHSDVFYVREALRIRLDYPVGEYPFTLDEIEQGMLAEGWT